MLGKLCFLADLDERMETSVVSSDLNVKPQGRALSIDIDPQMAPFQLVYVPKMFLNIQVSLFPALEELLRLGLR